MNNPVVINILWYVIGCIVGIFVLYLAVEDENENRKNRIRDNKGRTK